MIRPRRQGTVPCLHNVWGELLSSTGTLADTIGQKNPLRYRGYYFDSETGFYYLQSRYYDPVVQRFLNGDSQLNQKDGILGYNMFAYCHNNPIMYSDPTGHSIIAFVGLGILVVGMVFGLSSSTPTNQNYNIENRSVKDPVNPSKPPNPESGYVPPKKNPNPTKVKNPNGPGKGWPADNGGVWIPDNNQDGGPGWVVQFPNGGHEHRYPNGGIRTHKSSTSYNNTSNYILGGAIIVGTGISIIFVMADNVTGFGTADDVSLPVLFATFTKGVQMIGG